MRMKIASLSILLLAASAMPLQAAQAQTKIGVVNVARLLQESPQAQAASQALENEFAARRRELESQQKDLKAREDKLQKDGAVMAAAERSNAEKTLRDGQREFARKQNEFLEDLNVRRNEVLGQLQRTILQEVQTFAKGAGLDVVVSEAALREPVGGCDQPGARRAAGAQGCPREALSRASRRRTCQRGSPNWPCASAANCAATPIRSWTASLRSRTRGRARSASSRTRSTVATCRRPAPPRSCSMLRPPRSARSPRWSPAIHMRPTRG